jgi:hypothetical protein
LNNGLMRLQGRMKSRKRVGFARREPESAARCAHFKYTLDAAQSFHHSGEVSPTADLKLQVYKSELHIFVLCGDALDIQANGAKPRGQYGNHAAAIFYLYAQAHRVGSLDLSSQCKEISRRAARAIPTGFGKCPDAPSTPFLGRGSPEWHHRAADSSTWHSYAHTFGAADAEGSGFASDHRVFTGLCEMGHHDMWQGIAQRHVDDQGFYIGLAQGAQCSLHRLLIYGVQSRVVRH